MILLDNDWKLLNAHIDAPRGDRLAEELMRQNGGVLNVRQLAVPMLVRWMPVYHRPNAAGLLGLGRTQAVWIRLLPDGTPKPGTMRMSALLRASYPSLSEKFDKNLSDKGVPPITKLGGRTEYEAQ